MKRRAAVAPAPVRAAKVPHGRNLEQVDFISLDEQGDCILTCGDGDLGQLGHGTRRKDKKDVKTFRRVDGFPANTKFRQACAGSIFTAVLTTKHEVYTFGCNDDAALGRSEPVDGSDDDDNDDIDSDDDDREEEAYCFKPEKAEISDNLARRFGKVTMISTGDGHTAALTEKGAVLACGLFRDPEGKTAFKADIEKATTFQLIWPVEAHSENFVPIVKISSGYNHLMMLGTDGTVFTVGCGDSGQLGRVAAVKNTRSSESNKRLIPMSVSLPKKAVDIFASGYMSFAKCAGDGKILAWGLNNYGQLGLKGKVRGDVLYQPREAAKFKANQNWKKFIGEHHVLALTETGRIFGLGRANDYRLSDNNDRHEELVEILVPNQNGNFVAKEIAAGLSTNMIVSQDGSVYGFGYDANYELGLGKRPGEDTLSEAQKQKLRCQRIPKKAQSNDLDGCRVLTASLGGQHCVLMAAKVPDHEG